MDLHPRVGQGGSSAVSKPDRFPLMALKAQHKCRCSTQVSEVLGCAHHHCPVACSLGQPPVCAFGRELI